MNAMVLWPVLVLASSPHHSALCFQKSNAVYTPGSLLQMAAKKVPIVHYQSPLPISPVITIAFAVGLLPLQASSYLSPSGDAHTCLPLSAQASVLASVH